MLRIWSNTECSRTRCFKFLKCENDEKTDCLITHLIFFIPHWTNIWGSMYLNIAIAHTSERLIVSAFFVEQKDKTVDRSLTAFLTTFLKSFKFLEMKFSQFYLTFCMFSKIISWSKYTVGNSQNLCLRWLAHNNHVTPQWIPSH